MKLGGKKALDPAEKMGWVRRPPGPKNRISRKTRISRKIRISQEIPGVGIIWWVTKIPGADGEGIPLPPYPHSGRPRDLGHPPYDPTPGISWEIRISPRLVGKTFKPDFTPQNRIFPTRDPSESLPFGILRRVVLSKPMFVGKVPKISHFCFLALRGEISILRDIYPERIVKLRDQHFQKRTPLRTSPESH